MLLMRTKLLKCYRIPKMGRRSEKLILSTNPVYTPLSLVANFHQQKSSSIGLQVKFERQGDIVKGGENFTLPEIPMII